MFCLSPLLIDGQLDLPLVVKSQNKDFSRNITATLFHFAISLNAVHIGEAVPLNGAGTVKKMISVTFQAMDHAAQVPRST